MNLKTVFIGLLSIGLVVACSPEKQIAKQVDKQADKQIAKQVDKQAVLTESLLPKEKTRAAAKALFAYHEGIWDIKWDWVDADGKLLGTLKGTDTYTTIMDGSVQEIFSEVPALGPSTKAVMTYNEAEQKIIFFSMGAKGDYWLMKQDPVTGTMVSEPHVNPDGSSQIIRFTRARKTKNEMDMIMKSSTDGGKTWVKTFTMYMVRRAGE